MEKKTIDNIDYNYELYTQIENLKIIKEWISDTDILLRKIEKMDINNIQKQLEEAYQRGVEDGCNETWEAAKKILCMSTEKIEECFDVDESTIWLFYHMNVAEAIAKLKAYEDKKKADDEIKVGDVIANNTEPKLKVWVTCFDEIGFCGIAITDFGIVDEGKLYASCSPKGWHKIGHFDIEKILEEMKGDNESNISRH